MRFTVAGACSVRAVIDLRSATLTKPTPAMLAAMASAEVGDEQFHEDPTVNELQRRMAQLLGHEAAVFLPTATMANQVALRAQTRPGSVILAEERTHILIYEWGGPAIHSGLVMHGVPAEKGRPTPEQILADEDLGAGGVVVLENTHRSSGGRIWPLEEFAAAAAAARARGATVHLDGARLFNASVAAGIPPADWARLADSVTICFSKGLGCPLGAILAGSEQVIEGAWGRAACQRLRRSRPSSNGSFAASSGTSGSRASPPPSSATASPSGRARSVSPTSAKRAKRHRTRSTASARSRRRSRRRRSCSCVTTAGSTSRTGSTRTSREPGTRRLCG